MKTIRVKFTKDSSVKFISHLDMMNAFQRAVRRAGLKAEYSKGFNPQMIMVFGAPLSLGYTSNAEYADLSFTKEYTPKYIMETLGKELPQGLKLIEAAHRSVKKNIMADISYAQYEFIINGLDGQEKLIEKIITAPTIEVEKIRKGKTKTVDIKPLIVEFSVENNKGMLLAKAGNSGNLNPALLAKALSEKIGKNIAFTEINRHTQFVSRSNKMVDPISKEAVETI